MMKIFCGLGMIAALLVCGLSFGQIRTVECYPVGAPGAEPVIELGSGQELYFCFDDLSADVNSYSYKIVHCDPDWQPSGLSPFTYLNGFISNPLEDYEYSFNTLIPYTHFSLTLPNSEVSMKISGNYLLEIYNDSDPDSVVLAQRFSVLEKRVGIRAAVVNATDPRYFSTSQQLNFSVTYEGLTIYNPVRDVRVYVTQNQDPNTRRSFSPNFVRPNQLVYGNGVDNIFNGLSPFRNFQCSSLVYYTQYVRDILKGPEGRYNVILQPGKVPQRYVPLPDRAGNFYVQAENVQNPVLEAEYVVVHFAVYYPEPIPQADVYIYGKFAGWQLLPELRMTYDAVHKAYVGEGLFKQGYYDYMYAVVPQGSRKPELVTLQNNFYQTPDVYEIRFYMYDYNLMCFRFLGYQQLTAGL